MGNLQQESSLNPNTSGGGLAQWIGQRGTSLKSYALQHGLSPSSLEAQLGYLTKELNSGTEGVTAADLNKLSPAQAAQLFSDKFERPSAQYAMNNKRQGYANQFYKLYGSSSYKNSQ